MLTSLDVLIMQCAAAFVLGVVGLLAVTRDVQAPGAKRAKQLWLSTSPAKRWAEVYFLKYSLTWISWFSVVVLSGVWKGFGPWAYMAVGLAMAVPCAVAPLWLEPEALRVGPVTSRYWFKATVWIAIFSYVGNYFWTHYFYLLLGASYTFQAHRINDVPIAMFLCTHAYFCTYHTVTTAALRRWWTSRTYASVPRPCKHLGTSALVLVLAYITAMTEGVTIANFEYYAIKDREFFYLVGSFVYGIYFVVSFPMYARLDEVDCEEPGVDGVPPPSPARVGKQEEPARAPAPSTSGGAPMSATFFALDALAASMLVTILLDLWRLGYAAATGKDAPGMLPWTPK